MHPDAQQTDYMQNTIIVGSAGAGKSIAMRRLLVDMMNDSEVYPVYSQLEHIWARPLSDVVGAGALGIGSTGDELYAACSLSLAIWVVKRINFLLGEEAALSIAQMLPHDNSRVEDVHEWISAMTRSYNRSARRGLPIEPFALELPTIGQMFEDVAGVVKAETGRRPVFLFDQLDKITPVYFELLTELLGRSANYHSVVATRPSPCAPEETNFNPRVGDCEIVWIGTSWTGTDWGKFLSSAARDWFGPRTCEILSQRLETVSAIVGPSVRNYLRLGVNITQALEKHGVRDNLVHRALGELRDSQEQELLRALAGYPSSEQFMMNLKTKFDINRRAESGSWPSAMEIVPTKGGLSHVAKQRLRVATREGLLVPSSPRAYGIDSPGFSYRVVPLCGASSLDANRTFSDADVAVDISDQEFEIWANPYNPRRSAVKSKPSVFYSHWMSEKNEHVKEFLPRFKNLLHQSADVVIGRGKSSDILADMIREYIRQSSVVAVQLDPFRPAIGLEVGWAMGAGKEVRLGASNTGVFAQLPSWITVLEHYQNRTEVETQDFARHCHVALEVAESTPLSRRSRLASSLVGPFQRERRQLVLVGTGDALEAARSRIADDLAMENMAGPLVFDTGNASEGGYLVRVVEHARSATTLVVVMTSDRNCNLLANAALGAHTFRDFDRIQVRGANGRRREVKAPRIAYVIDEKLVENAIPSSLIGGMRDSFVSHDISAVCDRARNSYFDVVRKFRQAES
ncbi:hypothetical protein [Gordonia amicalis]|uniref:hypothetical protein n=1 Tax=Gordonia amicalis TaxID=89053 RepID=UPI003A80E27C